MKTFKKITILDIGEISEIGVSSVGEFCYFYAQNRNGDVRLYVDFDELMSMGGNKSRESVDSQSIDGGLELCCIGGYIHHPCIDGSGNAGYCPVEDRNGNKVPCFPNMDNCEN